MSYLQSETLLDILSDYNVSVNDLQVTDTYNEILIKIKIQSYKINDQKLLLTSAVQLAIVGFGGKNLGSIIKNGILTPLNSIFNDLGVKYNNVLNSKLNDDDLTPRRLIRFFRFHILGFIKSTKKPSYLWNKYSDKETNDGFLNCFPGAEHLLIQQNHIECLIKAYKNLDYQKGTHICDRIIRVLQARGVIDFNGTYIKQKPKM